MAGYCIQTGKSVEKYSDYGSKEAERSAKHDMKNKFLLVDLALGKISKFTCYTWMQSSYLGL